jgi:hypothetical protein
MMGSSKLTNVGDSVKKEIEDILQQKSESWLPSGKIARRTFGITFAYDDAIEALTRGDYTKFLGKAVLVRPPKTYEEMSQEEKEAFEGVLGGNEADIKLFKHWSKPPEAEIIGVKIEKGAAPIGLAYIYPTVLDGLETLREKNLQSFNWNKKNFSLIDVVSPVINLSAARFSDIFDTDDSKAESEGEAAILIKPGWTLTSRLNSEEKTSLRRELMSAGRLEDSTRLSTTGMAIIDLRTTLPPNKVYTEAGRKAAAKFECVADSTLEKIELAFADMNPDINMACKLAMADSLKIGLSVAGVQIIQSYLPEILGLIGAAIGGFPGGAAGHISGRVINAALVTFENGITQIIPLGYGAVYFKKKGDNEAAAWCVARLIVSIIQTIFQALTPELTAMLPAGKIKDILLKGITREIFINIGTLFVDFIASLEQADALNPGQKAEILSSLSKIVPVWDREMTPEEFQKLENSIDLNIQKDLQQVNNLFDAFKNLRYSEQNKE